MKIIYENVILSIGGDKTIKILALVARDNTFVLVIVEKISISNKFLGIKIIVMIILEYSKWQKHQFVLKVTLSLKSKRHTKISGITTGKVAYFTKFLFKE
jgi:hypothetical protein